MKTNILKFIPLVFLFFFLQAHCADALVMYVERPDTNLVVGDTSQFKVYLDTEGVEINVLEGVVKVSDNVEIESINKSGSIFDLWPEELDLKEGNEIYFVAGTPGGVFGKHLHVFNMDIVPQNTETIQIEYRDIVGYLNDGVGTKVESQSSNVFEVQAISKKENAEMSSPVGMERYNILGKIVMYSGVFVLMYSILFFVSKIISRWYRKKNK